MGAYSTPSSAHPSESIPPGMDNRIPEQDSGVLTGVAWSAEAGMEAHLTEPIAEHIKANSQAEASRKGPKNRTRNGSSNETSNGTRNGATTDAATAAATAAATVARTDQATMGALELEPRDADTPRDCGGCPGDLSAIIGRATARLRAPALGIRPPAWILVARAVDSLLHQRLLAQV